MWDGEEQKVRGRERVCVCVVVLVAGGGGLSTNVRCLPFRE